MTDQAEADAARARQATKLCRLREELAECHVTIETERQLRDDHHLSERQRHSAARLIQRHVGRRRLSQALRSDTRRLVEQQKATGAFPYNP